MAGNFARGVCRACGQFRDTTEGRKIPEPLKPHDRSHNRRFPQYFLVDPVSARRLSTGGGAITLPSLHVMAGVVAAIGGLAWAVKAAAILATGDQPPLVFEAAPLFFGVALTALALTSDLRGGRRKTAIALGLLAVTAGVVAGVTEAVGQVWGPAIAASSLALIAGLLLLGRRASSASHRFAWWIGVSILPALVVGGLLSAINERLLEVSILTLGLMWLWLGGILLSKGTRAGSTEPRPDRLSESN